MQPLPASSTSGKNNNMLVRLLTRPTALPSRTVTIDTTNNNNNASAAATPAISSSSLSSYHTQSVRAANTLSQLVSHT